MGDTKSIGCSTGNSRRAFLKPKKPFRYLLQMSTSSHTLTVIGFDMIGWYHDGDPNLSFKLPAGWPSERSASKQAKARTRKTNISFQVRLLWRMGLSQPAFTIKPIAWMPLRSCSLLGNKYMGSTVPPTSRIFRRRNWTRSHLGPQFQVGQQIFHSHLFGRRNVRLYALIDRLGMKRQLFNIGPGFGYLLSFSRNSPQPHIA